MKLQRTGWMSTSANYRQSRSAVRISRRMVMPELLERRDAPSTLITALFDEFSHGFENNFTSEVSRTTIFDSVGSISQDFSILETYNWFQPLIEKPLTEEPIPEDRFVAAEAITSIAPSIPASIAALTAAIVDLYMDTLDEELPPLIQPVEPDEDIVTEQPASTGSGEVPPMLIQPVITDPESEHNQEIA